MTAALIAEIAHFREQLRQAKADRDTFRELSERLRAADGLQRGLIAIATRSKELDDCCDQRDAAYARVIELESEVKELRAERDRMRKQLNSILAMTGQVWHTTHEECMAAQCGCLSLTAEEAVAALLEEMKEADADCVTLFNERDELRKQVQQLQARVLALAERVAQQSEFLSRRAEAPVDGWG